jgi:hypothetical protein
MPRSVSPLTKALRPVSPAERKAVKAVEDVLAPMLKKTAKLPVLEQAFMSQALLFVAARMQDESRRTFAAEVRAEAMERAAQPRARRATPKRK